MKKLIQICSMLALVVFFSIVSAQAQTVKQYEAEIPYDFNIGEKSYQAGSYVIKVTKVTESGAALSLEDKEKNVLQTLMVQQNGNTVQREPKLLFTSYENRRFLTGMAMQEMGVSIFVSKSDKASVNPHQKRVTIAASQK